MSKPWLLAHPGYRNWDDRMRGMYCYVSRHPGPSGPSLALRRGGGDVIAQFGDWDGNVVEPHDDAHRLHRPKSVRLLRPASVSCWG